MNQDPRKWQFKNFVAANTADYQPRRRLNWWLFGVLVLLAGAAYWGYRLLKPVPGEPVVQIVGVSPSYRIIKLPRQQCHSISTSIKVKNPNSNFLNHLFDSKNHPKYIEETATKQVCGTVYQESQVINGYVIKYQFGQYLESMLISADKVPPRLKSILPLSRLQYYQTSAQPKLVSETK